jgi:hypothetical protein
MTVVANSPALVFVWYKGIGNAISKFDFYAMKGLTKLEAKHYTVDAKRALLLARALAGQHAVEVAFKLLDIILSTSTVEEAVTKAREVFQDKVYVHELCSGGWEICVAVNDNVDACAGEASVTHDPFIRIYIESDFVPFRKRRGDIIAVFNIYVYLTESV